MLALTDFCPLPSCLEAEVRGCQPLTDLQPLPSCFRNGSPTPPRFNSAWERSAAVVAGHLTNAPLRLIARPCLQVVTSTQLGTEFL